MFRRGARQGLGFPPQPLLALADFSWPWDEDGATSFEVWSVCWGGGGGAPLGLLGGLGVLVKPSGLRQEERQDDPRAL